jgi:hypothetical protein
MDDNMDVAAASVSKAAIVRVHVVVMVSFVCTCFTRTIHNAHIASQQGACSVASAVDNTQRYSSAVAAIGFIHK